MAKLDIYQGGVRIIDIGLGDGECVIGRGEGAHVRLAEPGISRVHLVVSSSGKGRLAEDRSTNGVLLGGRPLESPTLLKDGDELALGSYRVVYRAEEAGPEKPTSVIRGAATRIFRRDRDGGLSSRRPVLTVRSPGAAPERRLLAGPRMRIGKHPDNDLVLPDEFVSAFHCALELVPEGLRLRDLGSTNGTFLDGRQASDALLVEGGLIEIGETRIEVAFEEDPGEAAPLGREGFGAMLGRSAVMQPVFEMLRKLAPTDATVLITGESGTGKELAARGLHSQGRRAAGPFVALNLAALPSEVVESELFGHEKGAFTGAVARRLGAFREASGGTLFLDEAAEMPLPAQAKLLRALETKTVKPVGLDREAAVDVRLVVATHRRLEEEVAAGRFREDLYYRLYVVPVTLPPLRARRGDVPLLAGAVLDEAPPGGRKSLTPEALAILEGHDWPGNVRELRNVLTRAAILADGPAIRPEHIAFPPAFETDDLPAAGGGYGAGTLAEMEARVIRQRLSDNNWIYRKTALTLGISPSTLKEKCKRYGILKSDTEE